MGRWVGCGGAHGGGGGGGEGGGQTRGYGEMGGGVKGVCMGWNLVRATYTHLTLQSVVSFRFHTLVVAALYRNDCLCIGID